MMVRRVISVCAAVALLSSCAAPPELSHDEMMDTLARCVASSHFALHRIETIGTNEAFTVGDLKTVDDATTYCSKLDDFIDSPLVADTKPCIEFYKRKGELVGILAPVMYLRSYKPEDQKRVSTLSKEMIVYDSRCISALDAKKAKPK